MTTEQLRKRMTYWLTRLQMDPWNVEVKVVDIIDDNEHHHASCTTSADYLRAVIKFNKSYIADSTKKDIDTTIVHELLHCLFRDLEAAWEAPDVMLGAVVAELHSERMRHEYEQLVDRLAVTIVALNAK